MVKDTIEVMQKIAADRGGECLSGEYVHSTVPLRWRCKKGHEWEARPNNIKQGTWCRRCLGNRPLAHTLSDLDTFAEQKGGRLITRIYEKTIDRLTWECSKGHRWVATFHDVKRGTWCPRCVREKSRLTMTEIRNIAARRFGKCLSRNYTSKETRLVWECDKGHRWEATLNNVKYNNSWCPECVLLKNEGKFRETLELLTGEKFIKVRPGWLTNSEGNALEIDGYNDKLKIGFEYQGKQHFRFIPFMHKTKDKFERLVHNDEEKARMLKDAGIFMLYPTYRLSPSDFELFIKINLERRCFLRDCRKRN